MEIHADFWPGQRLSKKLSWRRGLYVSFSTAGLHPGSWIIDCQWVEKSSMWWFMSRKRDFYGVIWRCFARVKCEILWVFLEVLWLPRKSFIVWFTESVDRQISGMCGWARVTRILCAKHKNASWVFSLGDFVLAYSVLKDCGFLICFRPKLRYGRHGLTD